MSTVESSRQHMASRTAQRNHWRVYTAAGHIDLRPVRYVVAPIPVTLALMQEAAKRSLDHRYVSPYTQISRLPSHLVPEAHARIQGCLLGSILLSGPAGHVRLLRTAARLIVRRGDATGLESIYTSALQSAWPYADRSTLASCLNVWDRFVRHGTYISKNTGFVYDGSTRTITSFQPEEMSRFSIQRGLLDLVGPWQSAAGFGDIGPTGGQGRGGFPGGSGFGPGGDYGSGDFGSGDFGTGDLGTGGDGPGGYGPGGYGPGGRGPGGFGPGGDGEGESGPGGFGPGGRGAGTGGHGSGSGDPDGPEGSDFGTGGGGGGFAGGGFGPGATTGGGYGTGDGGWGEPGSGGLGGFGPGAGFPGGPFVKGPEQADGYDGESGGGGLASGFGTTLVIAGMGAAALGVAFESTPLVLVGAANLAMGVALSGLDEGHGGDGQAGGGDSSGGPPAGTDTGGGTPQGGDSGGGPPSGGDPAPAPGDPPGGSGGGSGSKPNPGQKPNPMSFLPNSGDYYPNPEDPNGRGGGGPRAVGIGFISSLGAFGPGLATLTMQVGKSTYRVMG
jgi:hypothetical protein